MEAAFPNLEPVDRPIVKAPEKIDPNWLAGFTDGEGCFSVVIFKSETKTGSAIQLSFILTQHTRDVNLINSLIQYFNCGQVNESPERSYVNFKVTNLSDIEGKIIPFFREYPLHGTKRLDFEDFCKIIELVKNKEHLTSKGLEEIRKIQSSMNRNRKLV